MECPPIYKLQDTMAHIKSPKMINHNSVLCCWEGSVQWSGFPMSMGIYCPSCISQGAVNRKYRKTKT